MSPQAFGHRSTPAPTISFASERHLPRWRIERFDELDSTSTRARELAECGAEGPLLVVARSQTTGRGRQGRSWQSMFGNLLCTALWRPDALWPALSTLPLAIALAVKSTVDRLAESEIASIKWPNDVLIDGRKVAGILVETGIDPTGRRWVAAGIGLNIVAHPPANDGLVATSLHAEGIFGPDASAVADCLIEALDEILPIWCAGGFEPLRDRYCAASPQLGRLIEVRGTGDSSPNLRGIYSGIAPDGRLMLQGDDGLHLLSVGDVFGLGR